MVYRLGKPYLDSLIITALFLSIMLWTYLAMTTEMIIVHDAIGYEQLAQRIHDQGISNYLKNGVKREPLYPILVSISMKIEDFTHVSYQTIQIILQILLLLLTQLLLLYICRFMHLANSLTFFVLLYFGLSPSLNNSALRLYSEILTYPLILGMLILGSKLWNVIHSTDNSPKKIFFYSTITSILLALLTLTKGVFEIVIPLLLIPYIISFLKSVTMRQPQLKAHLTIFLVTFLFCTLIPINLYKYANKIHNNQFVLTDRGAYALYGESAIRTDSLTRNQILAAFAYAPTWRFCQFLFNKDTCDYWSFEPSNSTGSIKRSRLLTQYSPEDTNKKLIQLTISNIFKNPLQYAILSFAAALRLFFWESPTMQYIYYPDWIIQFFSLKPINIGLYIMMPFLTVVSTAYWIVHLIFLKEKVMNKDVYLINSSALIIISSYIFSYSFFSVVPRYSFPMIPLYLILIATFIQNLVFKKSVHKNQSLAE